MLKGLSHSRSRENFHEPISGEQRYEFVGLSEDTAKALKSNISRLPIVIPSSSSGQAVPPARRFPRQSDLAHVPLPETDMRLLSFVTVGFSTLSISFETFDQSKAPPYIALSYVWSTDEAYYEMTLKQSTDSHLTEPPERLVLCSTAHANEVHLARRGKYRPDQHSRTQSASSGHGRDLQPD